MTPKRRRKAGLKNLTIWPRLGVPEANFDPDPQFCGKNLKELFLVSSKSTRLMKAKLLILSALASLSLAMPAIAETRVVGTTSDGRPIVASTGKHWRNHYRDSRTSWGIGLGFGAPFSGGYYGGYPYGFTYSPYSYGYGYGNYYSRDPYYYNRTVYRGYDRSLVARVQARLARAGYYAGPIDGVMGPHTRYAIRAYEYRHRLPVDGRIDGRLLARMGLA
jgi:Putative peptidoglycan binding domain